jgi:hypothetical protein
MLSLPLASQSALAQIGSFWQGVQEQQIYDNCFQLM